jgi:hypothetical protein
VKCISVIISPYRFAAIKIASINSPVIGVYQILSGAKNDILIGGAGNDTLTGAGGRDIFDYGFKNAGNDAITAAVTKSLK